MTADERRIALSAEISRLRRGQGMTQKELEKISGVRQPIIARIEKGIVAPQLSTLMKILEPLGQTLAIVPIKK